MCGKYENINYYYTDSDVVCNSIFSLHLVRGVVYLIRNCKFSQNGKFGQKCKFNLVQERKNIYCKFDLVWYSRKCLRD